MAVEAVANSHVSIALACRTFQISECCYRYERKLNDEIAEIAEWLVKLTIACQGMFTCPRRSQPPHLGLRPVLLVSAECERFWLEP